MIEMNPYYAHDSSVGPVFDVATWSTRKNVTMVIAACAFGLLGLATVVAALKPELLMSDPPRVVREFHKETERALDRHAAVGYGVLGVATCAIFFAFAGTVALARDVVGGNYFFRIGRGGISIRVPDGLDPGKAFLCSKVLRRDLPFEQVAEWTIVQRRQAGALSRNVGNISAFLKVKLVNGEKLSFFLDSFREPAHVIQSKIDAAMQMVPANLAPSGDHQTGKATSTDRSAYRCPTRPVVSLEAKYEAVTSALEYLADLPAGSGAVVFADADGDHFVQFARPHEAFLLDVPRASLDDRQWERAESYFRELPASISDQATPDQGGAAVAVAPETGIQFALTDADEAARITLELFLRVYQLPAEFGMSVEILS